MASRKIEDLDPRFRPKAQQALDQWNSPLTGMDVRLTCTLRTFAEQAIEYSRGRTTAGVPCVHDGVARPIRSCPTHPWGSTVTGAQAGFSWHNYGLAVDVAPFVSGKPVWKYVKGGLWDQMAVIGKSVGMIWGGDWVRKDRPHFEWHPGYTTSGTNGVRLAKKRFDAGKNPIPLSTDNAFDDVISGGSSTIGGTGNEP